MFCEQKGKDINRTRVVFTIVVLLSVVSFTYGINSAVGASEEIAINDILGLTESGIEVGLGITSIYQQNVHGGLSTHRQAGRHTGSYDLEISADLEKLLGLEGGGFFVHVEGGWPDTEGIDGRAVGSVFGVNADAIGNRTMDIVEFFYEGAIFGDAVNLMAGKLDFTGIFDCSAYADDETSQFLNGAFVDNPTIPFPAYSLGVVLSYNLSGSWYLMGGVADAQADGRETGFRTTFHKEDYFLYMLETGIRPEQASANGSLAGAYRVGLWNDPQPKANSDSSKYYRDDVGFYVSCDQALTKENADPEDSQGFGAFLRYGCANSGKNDIANFWSLGVQYQGLLDGRDDDVLGLGFAKGIFSNGASTSYTNDYESVIELYYNARVTPSLSISPNVQYVTNPSNPDNTKSAGDAVVLGLRVQMSF